MSFYRKAFNKPNHFSLTSLQGQNGFWILHGTGNYYFITPDGILFIPKSLRGKKVYDINDDHFNNLPEHEKNNPDYQEWLIDFQKNKNVEKIYNNHEFTKQGRDFVEKLRKFFIKNKFNKLETFGFNKEYSFDITYFDKLLAQNSLDRVKFYGRRIARNFRTIIEMMRNANKDVNKIEQDFYYLWNKLSSIFDFDPQSFTADEEVLEDSKESLICNTVENFISETINFITPQMIEIQNSIDKLYKSSKKSSAKITVKNFISLKELLNKYKTNYSSHDMGKNAKKILQSSSFLELQNIFQA